MTDSHTHLDRLEDPAAGVDPELKAIVTVGTDPDRNELALGLAASHPNVWAAVGIHPAEATLAAEASVRQRLEQQARAPKVVAIGETGFDTHWDDTQLEPQRAAFDFQASLAHELDLPLILHVRDRQGTRSASEAACSALEEAGWGKGILHCFNGDEELLRTGLSLGWYVSFAGNLTYRSAAVIQAAATEVPADRLLVETDAPFLTPEPHRGKRNRPAFVRHTAAFLAQLRGLPLDELEPVLDANTFSVFGLAP